MHEPCWHTFMTLCRFLLLFHHCFHCMYRWCLLNISFNVPLTKQQHTDWTQKWRGVNNQSQCLTEFLYLIHSVYMNGWLLLLSKLISDENQSQKRLLTHTKDSLRSDDGSINRARINSVYRELWVTGSHTWFMCISDRIQLY